MILDSKKRLFTWGFGGYGRLGHADNKDEMVPRMVKLFEGPNKGATKIAAGSTFTFGLNEYGELLLSFCEQLKDITSRPVTAVCMSFITISTLFLVIYQVSVHLTSLLGLLSSEQQFL